MPHHRALKPGLVLSLLPLVLMACAPDGAPDADAESGAAEARGHVDPATQIAEAVLAAPAPLRDGAGVMGYDEEGALVSLREGDNPLLCEADDPASPGFHVVCYHRDLDPFIQRGRELRAEGVAGAEVDSVRFREIRQGELPWPDGPRALYNLAADRPPEDPETGRVEDARWLHVVYLPDATGDEVGMPDRPVGDFPWLMDAGTPKAHVMFSR